MKRLIILIVAILLIGISLGAWYWHSHKKTAAATVKPTLVSMTTATIKTIPLTIKALGQIVAPQTIMLKTQAAGVVTQIYFKSGQIVTKGQLLLQIDPTAANAQVTQQAANYKNLKTQYDRYLQLIKLDPGSVSADMLSQKKEAVKAAKAQWQAAKQTLDYTKIIAPFNGVIGLPEQISNQVSVASTSLNEPVQLNVGSYLPAGSPVAILSKQNNMSVQYQVPQNYSSQLQIGQKVQIKISAFPKQVFTGVVKYISPVVYQSNQAYDVVATIANQNLLMRSGMNVSVVQVLNPNQQVLTIPGLALVPSLSGYAVYTIENSKVQSVPVTIGQRYGDLVEILSGLKAGDQVITSGALNVHPGVMVTS